MEQSILLMPNAKIDDKSQGLEKDAFSFFCVLLLDSCHSKLHLNGTIEGNHLNDDKQSENIGM